MIIGVDPGNTTGVAMYSTKSDITSFTSFEAGWESVTIALSHTDLVVCERFFIGKRTLRAKNPAKAATHVIGQLRSQCTDVGARFTMQSASDAKTFASNELLKALEWYRIRMPHANDAARHVLLALARHDVNHFDQLMKEIHR